MTTISNFPVQALQVMGFTLDGLKTDLVYECGDLFYFRFPHGREIGLAPQTPRSEAQDTINRVAAGCTSEEWEALKASPNAHKIPLTVNGYTKPLYQFTNTEEASEDHGELAAKSLYLALDVRPGGVLMCPVVSIDGEMFGDSSQSMQVFNDEIEKLSKN